MFEPGKAAKKKLAKKRMQGDWRNLVKQTKKMHLAYIEFSKTFDQEFHAFIESHDRDRYRVLQKFSGFIAKYGNEIIDWQEKGRKYLESEKKYEKA